MFNMWSVIMDAITCDACGKQFTWREEFEGRELTCTCGAKIRMGGAGEVRAEAAIAGAPGGKAVAMRRMVGHRARPQAVEAGMGLRRDWVAPILLLGVGLLGRLVEFERRRVGGPGAEVEAVLAVTGIVLAAAAVAIGMFVAARVLGSELESPLSLLRKALGLAALATALTVLCANFQDSGRLRGGIFAMLLVMLVYFVGICRLSKTDLLEGMVAAVIAVAVQVGLYVAVAKSLPQGMARLMFFGS